MYVWGNCIFSSDGGKSTATPEHTMSCCKLVWDGSLHQYRHVSWSQLLSWAALEIVKHSKKNCCKAGSYSLKLIELYCLSKRITRTTTNFSKLTPDLQMREYEWNVPLPASILFVHQTFVKKIIPLFWNVRLMYWRLKFAQKSLLLLCQHAVKFYVVRSKLAALLAKLTVNADEMMSEIGLSVLRTQFLSATVPNFSEWPCRAFKDIFYARWSFSYPVHKNIFIMKLLLLAFTSVCLYYFIQKHFKIDTWV